MALPGDDLLDSVFSDFLIRPKIFKNREVLRHDFVPAHLPHREEHIRHLGGILAPALRGSRSSNVFIYGKPGTGKTAVVRYVLSRLVQKGQDMGGSVRGCYVNCRVAGTDYRVLASLCEAVGISVPFTGLAKGEVFDRFRAALDARRVLLVGVFDEVDALVRGQGDAVLYELTRINEGLRAGKFSIIGISNDLRFKEFLDPRVLSSLSEEEVVFRPYTAVELRDILLERAKLAFVEGALSEGVLNLCAALDAAEQGDARRALDLLRVAAELAEREGKPCVVEEHVRQAQEKIEQDRVVEVMRTLPLHSKLVLFSVYLMKKADVSGAVTGNIYEVYRELCGQLAVEVLTQRRVSGLISELDMIGLLTARVVSFGRYGRTKKVYLSVPRGVVRNVLAEDNWVGRLISYEPKCLSRGE